MTTFQKNIKREHLIELTRMLHPDLPEEALGKIGYDIKYTWVCVRLHWRPYGVVDFGIDNHSTMERMFGPIKMTDAEKAVKEGGAVKWRVWRFISDKLNTEDEDLSAAESYISKLYPLPSPQEFYREYMRD